MLTSEHWANFFLDHIGAFCVGRAEAYSGPVEPWLKIEKAEIKGDPELAAELIEAAYDGGIEPGFAYELEFDHGTMVPLHFLAPRMDRPVVPVMFNTLASPQPNARRCLELGRVIGRVAAQSRKRIGLIATGGLSHDPGEKNHGIIDSEFDHRFLSAMAAGDAEKLSALHPRRIRQGRRRRLRAVELGGARRRARRPQGRSGGLRGGQALGDRRRADEFHARAGGIVNRPACSRLTFVPLSVP